MSDKQKAVLALSIASQTCTTALNALASPTSLSSNHFTDAPSSTCPPPALETLHKDLLSILQLISHSLTRLALVLKPSGPPSYSASTPVLTELTSQISDLAGCTGTFGLHRVTYGEFLVKEVNQLVEEIVYTTRSLLQAYLHLASDSPRRRIGTPNVGVLDEDRILGSEESQDEYLRLTGTIHQLIDGAVGASAASSKKGKSKALVPGLSKNNAEAVRKLWILDGGSVKDGVRELKEMIDDYNDEDGDEDEGLGQEEEEDDGWGELGLGTAKLKKAEVERASQVLPLLNLTATLHTHLPTLFAPSPSTSSSSYFPTLPNPTLSLLPPLSASLLSTSDDLIASLYSPQNPMNISGNVRKLESVVKELESVFKPLYGGGSTLEEKMARMKVADGSEEEKEGAKREMLMGIFARVYAAAQGIERAISSESGS
ncbi:hypothetical protein GLOTRDRAFT_136897 [Gloeophyllum trabeum ATCC 11539]|uniref:Uncharacterized protein n=1 Tax=Gloeophyllum trabeum (strain ATCC 11539 / FP-39264 / Madison 617) TaxID=670483 RepID=S7RXM7_GLOTA|nr:uncharacterized protein GLOTRDRAFT_136897 [Gloeophyllum trabeum ATCC 11539]EPQ58119.1 hypothetical protein GLOTRDRAFT_136897 [Gloeophyllum trabeum ATCC 11539]